jgi:hypothetical protein
MGNPFFDKVELELSSIFDNIIFQVSSVFDYLAHITCYIVFKNKSASLYWTKLAKAARKSDNEFCNAAMRKIVDEVDRRFVARLYDYRSRLLHNKRDKHQFGGTTNLPDFRFNIRMLPSELALNHFKVIAEQIGQQKKVTLTYLSSWLIKKTQLEIESILDVLATEIKNNSSFQQNILMPKKEGALVMGSWNAATRSLDPVSDGLWRQYKTGSFSEA